MAKTAEFVPVGGAITVAVAAVLGGAFYPGQRLVIGVLLALLLGWFGSRRSQLTLDRVEWALLALVGWGAVSAALVGMSPLAAKEVVVGWLVAWCLWVTARRAGQRTAVMCSVILVGTALLVAGGITLEAIGYRELRVGGFFDSPNVAAALLVVSVPLLGVFWGGPRRGWLVVIALIIGGGVALTGSRAGLLALTAAGAVLLPRGRARTAGLAIGSGAMATILAWRFVSHPEILAWFRPAIWSGVLRLWAAHPVLGVGPGGLVDAAGPVRLLHADHVGQHQFLISYAESSPLGLLVQTGVVGLLLMVSAVFLWLRREGGEGALSFKPFRSAVVAMVVMAAFHDFVTIEIVTWWWVLVLGLIEAVRRPVDTASCQAPGLDWTRLVRGLVLAFIVLWGIVQPAWARWVWRTGTRDSVSVERALAAESWFDEPLEWQVRTLLEEGAWTWRSAAEALAVSREAVRIHPGASTSWMILGQVNSKIINEFGPWPDSVAGAQAAFARAAELEPYQPWPWLEWARLERGLGNLDESAELVRRALAAEPHAVRARLFLARVELDRGNMRPAREALESAAASTVFRKRAGLTTYERELLAAPMWQFREIEEALR